MPRHDASPAVAATGVRATRRSSQGGPPSAVRRTRSQMLSRTHQAPLHRQRSRSVHFSTEPVARDVQREMEAELQRWVQPALEQLFALDAHTRGAANVKACTAATGERRKVVLKTVAMTLPACRDSGPISAFTVATATTTAANAPSRTSDPRDFSSTDLSSDVSNAVCDPSSERDASTWSLAQLLPDISVTLFHEVGRDLPCVAPVLDVFTLASMLRHTEGYSESLGDEENSNGMVQMPRVSAQEMEMRGWAMADATCNCRAGYQRRLSTYSNSSKRLTRHPSHHGGETSADALRAAERNAPSTPPLPPLPHPTVFLYARHYMEGADTLEVVLQERWGRNRLPLTVLPKWAHYGAVTDVAEPLPGDPTAPPVLSAEDARRLEEHVLRWLSGCAKVEKRKRRLVEKRTAAAATAAEKDRHDISALLHIATAATTTAADTERLTRHDAADVLWSIATALESLHQVGHAHGNLKPTNVLVHQWDCDDDGQGQVGEAERDGPEPRQVCLTDHVLPLFPDALLEPGAQLTLPGWRTRETRGYACLKPHDATVLPHMFGGGPPGAPPVQASSYTISACWLSTTDDRETTAAVGARGTTVAVEGGVDGLDKTAYEAVLLQHCVAPENVLLVATGGADNAATATGEAYRIWVNLFAVTPASDVYALGVLAWAMLVGRLPPLPAYRRAARPSVHAQNHGSAVSPVNLNASSLLGETFGALQPPYANVMLRALTSLFESHLGTSNALNARQAERLRELAAFLHSAPAQTHLPLVLALARADDVRPVTMDLLVRLLHTDPRQRLTLAELKQHPFFRVYGSRRHELRRQYEAAQTRHGLTSRYALRGSEGKTVLMPRQMGALAGRGAGPAPQREKRRPVQVTDLEESRLSLSVGNVEHTWRFTRSPSASATTAGPATVTPQKKASSRPAQLRPGSWCAAPLETAYDSPTHRPNVGVPAKEAEKAAARETFQRSPSYGSAPSSPATSTMRRHGSSSSRSSHSHQSSRSPSSPSTKAGKPHSTTTTSTAPQQGCSSPHSSPRHATNGPTRVPSWHSHSGTASPDPAVPALTRTSAFHSKRRLSMTREPFFTEAPHLGVREETRREERRVLRDATAMDVNVSKEDRKGSRDVVSPRDRGEKTTPQVRRATMLSMPAATSWVSPAHDAFPAGATPSLTSPPSVRRLAPLAIEGGGGTAFSSAVGTDLDKTVHNFPLGPRRPAMRIRPAG